MLSVRVCVCVCERIREKKRARQRDCERNRELLETQDERVAFRDNGSRG